MNKDTEIQHIAQLMRLNAKYLARMGVPADIFANLEEAIKKGTKATCLRGFRLAATDIVQDMSDWEPQSLVTEFLEEVKAQTGKTAFELAGHPDQRLAKVLTSGKIKNDGEFYLLKEHISDDTAKKDRIEALLMDYEDSLRL